MARAAARRFVRAGYAVHLASRNLKELEKEAADVRLRYGAEVRVWRFEALDFAFHAAFYTQLEPRPDGVIAAFGLLGDQGEAQGDFGQVRAIIDTNYSGAVSILEVVAADFEARQSGFIVGISSVAGDRGRASNYLYGSAKAGFSAYLSGLRHRLFRSGVPVLTVKPGFVATKMTAGLELPKRLTAQPEAVAEAIYRGVVKRRNTVYVKRIWRLIMLIVVHLPEVVFKRSKL